MQNGKVKFLLNSGKEISHSCFLYGVGWSAVRLLLLHRRHSALLLCSGTLVLAKLKLRAVFGKMLLAAMKKLSETDFE